MTIDHPDTVSARLAHAMGCEVDELTPLHIIGVVLARLAGYGVAVWLVFEAGAGVHSDGSAVRRLWATIVVVAGLAIVLAVCTAALGGDPAHRRFPGFGAGGRPRHGVDRASLAVRAVGPR